MKKMIEHQLMIACFFMAMVCIIPNGALFGSPQEKKSDQRTTKEGTAPDQELTSFKDRLNQTIRVVNKLSSRVASLDSAQRATKSEITSLKNAVSKLQEVTQSLRASIDNLRGTISILKERVVYTDSINLQILSRIVALESRIVAITANIGGQRTVSNFGDTESVKITYSKSFKDRYQEAFTLHQKNRNVEAIEIFRQLIAEDRTNELSDNAQYWLGECYYSLKQYSRAVIEFEKVLSFANTNKDDDAQIKIALCYLSLGNRKKANEQFQILIDRYPRSEFVAKARQYMK